MFRIRDILVRIWIHKSVTLTNGSGSCSESCTFTSLFKDKKSLKSHKTVEIKVFRTIFAWWWKDPDPLLWLTDPEGPKTYGSGTLVYSWWLLCYLLFFVNNFTAAILNFYFFIFCIFLCRSFSIFERCLDSNPESCRSKQARYQLSHPSPFLATHLLT